MILGVSFDTPTENKAFAEKFGLPFPLLCDVDRAMGLAYGATDPGETRGARRVGCVIDATGHVKEWEAKVDAGEYPKQVLARL